MNKNLEKIIDKYQQRNKKRLDRLRTEKNNIVMNLFVETDEFLKDLKSLL